MQINKVFSILVIGAILLLVIVWERKKLIRYIYKVRKDTLTTAKSITKEEGVL